MTVSVRFGAVTSFTGANHFENAQAASQQNGGGIVSSNFERYKGLLVDQSFVITDEDKVKAESSLSAIYDAEKGNPALAPELHQQFVNELQEKATLNVLG